MPAALRPAPAADGGRAEPCLGGCPAVEPKGAALGPISVLDSSRLLQEAPSLGEFWAVVGGGLRCEP